MLISELLTDESKWTQGTYARDSTGVSCGVSEGICWCIMGAMFYCYGESDTPISQIMEKISSALKIAYPEYKGVSPIIWQDTPGRRFGEVQRVILIAGV